MAGQRFLVRTPIKRYGTQDFTFHDDHKATCTVGKPMTGVSTVYFSANGHPYQCCAAKAADCHACALRHPRLKGTTKRNDGRGRQISRFHA